MMMMTKMWMFSGLMVGCGVDQSDGVSAVRELPPPVLFDPDSVPAPSGIGDSGLQPQEGDGPSAELSGAWTGECVAELPLAVTERALVELTMLQSDAVLAGDWVASFQIELVTGVTPTSAIEGPFDGTLDGQGQIELVIQGNNGDLTFVGTASPTEMTGTLTADYPITSFTQALDCVFVRQ